MEKAFKEAQKAYDIDEVPVGAVIVKDGKIIARAYNEKEEKKDTTMHAEIIAIKKARKKRKMQIVVIAAENVQILRLFFARF